MLHELGTHVGHALNFVKDNVDVNDSMFHFAAAFILFNPTYWNVVGRLEHKTKFMTKMFCGSTIAANYFFAFTVFFLGIGRDYVYHLALANQTSLDIPVDELYIKVLGWSLYFVGLLFVGASSYKLGIDGTYLGDYFGILKDEKLSGFPFNIVDHPMYVGSTLNFLAHAVLYKSVAGLVLTVFVYVVYMVYSVTLEGPFTCWVYAEKAKRDALKDSAKPKKD